MKNNIVTATDLLNMYEIKPFLLGALFSRIMPQPKQGVIPEYFYCYANFRTSKVVYKTDFNLKVYAEELVTQYNNISGFPNWQIASATDGKVELRFYIKNDLNINSINFYNLIYQKLLKTDWLCSEELNESKKYFVRGFMETRGSVDPTVKFISQDYYYNNLSELKRVLIFTDLINIPISYINFNARDMQPQFVSGEHQRNTQFRINVLYYAKEIGFINKYKAQIFENAYHDIKMDQYCKDGVKYYLLDLPKTNDDVKFIHYLQFFTNNIYNKELDTHNIQILRSKLGLKDKTNKLLTGNRNKSIIDIFRKISKDECAICGTTKTFTNDNNQEYFEIHHVIPYYNGKNYDNIANLVKLCPTCHSLLKKGRASKQIQIEKIKHILENNDSVHQYAIAALGCEDIDELSEKIQTMLG